jgi:hypothetical protein
VHDHPATLDEYSWPVCVTPRCNRQLWANEAGRWACRPCEDFTAARIAELPSLFRQMNTTAALMRGASRIGSGSSGSKTPPIPVRLEVLALVGPGGVAARLQAIEDAWRQALGWPTAPPTAPRSVYPVWRDSEGARHVGEPVNGERVYPYWRTERAAAAVLRHVTFLTNNLLWACSSYESVGQDIDDLRRLHGECTAIVNDERKPGRVQIGACPGQVEGAPCAAPLTARADSHRVHCTTCDSRWETLGEWRELRAAQERVAAEEAERQQQERVAA